MTKLNEIYHCEICGNFVEMLQPGDPPEGEFYVQAKKIQAREYCNLHGL